MSKVRTTVLSTIAAVSAVGGTLLITEPFADDLAKGGSPAVRIVDQVPASSGFDFSVSPEMGVKKANLIATGKVIAFSSRRWTTLDGSPPALLPSGLPETFDVEYRVATVRLDRVIMGDAPTEIRLGVPGSEKDIEDVWAGWTEGDEVLLYLTSASSIPGWQLEGSDYAIEFGTTIEDGIAKGHPELSLDEGDIPIDEVVQRVEAAVAAGR